LKGVPTVRHLKSHPSSTIKLIELIGIFTIPKLTKNALNAVSMSTAALKMLGLETPCPPPFKFTPHPLAAAYTVSAQTYLSNHPGSPFKYVAAGAVVFDNPESKDPRILLIQRSPRDRWPNRWEFPGGACEPDDESILHSVARELWEESGLIAASIGPMVGEPHLFVSGTGKQIGKFNFFVEAERSAERTLEVKLSPREHQKFVWASEDEVEAKKMGDVELEFTTADVEATVLDAFKLRKDVNWKVGSSL
jgi:8-oxo-dGTP pyrophosphatase MutT (NUDIX family)